MGKVIDTLSNKNYLCPNNYYLCCSKKKKSMGKVIDTLSLRWWLSIITICVFEFFTISNYILCKHRSVGKVIDTLSSRANVRNNNNQAGAVPFSFVCMCIYSFNIIFFCSFNINKVRDFFLFYSFFFLKIFFASARFCVCLYAWYVCLLGGGCWWVFPNGI